MNMDSVWNNITLPEFPRLEQDVKTDVLIIGGGMAGLLCAYKLAQAGVDYLLIEADRICHGITRNTTAKITAQHGLIYDKLNREFHADIARLYWEANQAAVEQYRQLSTHIDCDFEPKDNAVYSTGPTLPLERELMTLQRFGANADFTDTLPLPFPISGAVRFHEQAQFHPLKFAAGIAKGLNIYEHTPAREWIGSIVLTDRVRIKAGAVIVATHFPLLNRHGSYFLKLYQNRSYVLALDYAPDPDCMMVDASGHGLSFRHDGSHLLLGGGAHRTGKHSENWKTLETFAQTHYPHAREAFRWAAQDCMTLDGIPYIGPYSKRTPNLFVATGFNKWGMTSSMVAASLLTDLVQGKETPYAAVFSPSRTILRPQLFLNAAESTLHLLTPTAPRCPHMGCALKWNPQEHSWDCPCHGSRFTKDGKLIDNPATGDLHLSLHS